MLPGQQLDHFSIRQHPWIPSHGTWEKEKHLQIANFWVPAVKFRGCNLLVFSRNPRIPEKNPRKIRVWGNSGRSFAQIHQMDVISIDRNLLKVHPAWLGHFFEVSPREAGWTSVGLYVTLSLFFECTFFLFSGKMVTRFFFALQKQQVPIWILRWVSYLLL